MQQFICPTQIIDGAGALDHLAQLQIQKLLLVTDGYFMESGIAQRVAQKAKAQQVEFFAEVRPDPTVELVARGTAMVREFAPDTIVALGGGSVLDCAKAMGFFAELPVVAIPTTSGSGSEVTDFAILTHGQVKHPLVDPKLRPKVAILDGTLLEKLPAKLVADTGFDVISHALEAYTARSAGAITDALAQQAFGITYAALPASFAGDLRVRDRIHTAACMAGIAFNQAGLGLCHGLSHSLGGMFHIPHGRLNAILLPAVIRCNSYTAAEKYARLARSAGLGGAADCVALRNLINGLIRLRRELKMPANLQEAGVPVAQLRRNTQALVESTLKDPCCATNAVQVEPFMIHRILEEVSGRG